MKLRIRGNSVRVRLGKAEVSELAQGKPIRQTTEFSSGTRLISSVEPATFLQAPNATFTDGSICVRLPLEQVQRWAKSEQVAIEANQPIDANRSLSILVEKDFQCIHSHTEENSDAYPNPREH
jgi:hypothetical protein